MRRIVAQLEADEPVSAERSMQMQTDWYNQYAADLLPRFLEALEQRLGTPGRERGIQREGERAEALQSARAVLAAWLEHPVSSPDLAGPLIFSLWHHNAIEEVFAPVPGDELYDDFLEQGNPYRSFEAILEADVTRWTPIVGVDPFLRRAFAKTVAELVSRFGPDPGSWRWGDVQTVELRQKRLTPP